MGYLLTFPLECGHFSPDVGKYTIHGSSGIGIWPKQIPLSWLPQPRGECGLDDDDFD